MSGIDWDALREVANDAIAHAYVPYSSFPVGAAAIVDDGRIGELEDSKSVRNDRVHP